MSQSAGSVAIVLHAHLPYVRHPEYERSLEERWLYEAIWESYLPLLDALTRLDRDGISAPITLSISPTLAAMFRDDLLRARFEGHLSRTLRLAQKHVARMPLLHFYVQRLTSARATWQRIGGDLLGAFVDLARRDRLELMTTAATHAYLPALASLPVFVRAQIRLGLSAFEALTGLRPRGLWLPECAYASFFADEIARANVRYTVLDAHGLELAKPTPPFGIWSPVLAPTGVAFFGRDPDVARAVWSRATGYPGDPLYRDFYRDLGFDLDVAELEGEVGPNGTRVMTGLKLHRVSGEGAAKAPYDPDLALDRAHDHAAHFVAARREELLARTRALGSPASSPLVSVAPFDAELFGHWWFEGPDFLERTLRLLATDPSIRATTLGAHLEAHPDLAVVEPAASTWGEGGFGDVWMGPRTARLLRPLHHAASTVLAAVRTSRDASGVAGHALDQSIREILLAQASDWPFMIHRGEMSEYAHGRVRIHSERAVSLARIATNAARGTPPTQADVALLHDIVARDRAFFELRGERLRAPFDLTA